MRMVFFVVAFAVALERSAQAYVDPGSGSMLFQTLFAVVIGVLFQFRRIVGLFRSRREGRDR